MNKRTCPPLTMLIAALLCVTAVAQLPPDHVDDFTGKPRVIVLSDMGNEPAHIILAVMDDGKPALTSYRRVILKVSTASR